MSRCIRQQRFDTEAFGVPYFRIETFERPKLDKELAQLVERRPLVIDAKIPADETAIAFLLQDYGFRKICTQVGLRRDVSHGDTRGSDARVETSLEVSDDILWAHARNFEYDRFSLDPALPRDGKDRLFHDWVRNSLSGGAKRVVCLGHDFCTFTEERESLRIDLVSVLDKGRDVSSALLSALVQYARATSKHAITVVTECENTRAWRLYVRNGFRVTDFYSVFHFVYLTD